MRGAGVGIARILIAPHALEHVRRRVVYSLPNDCSSAIGRVFGVMALGAETCNLDPEVAVTESVTVRLVAGGADKGQRPIAGGILDIGLECADISCEFPESLIRMAA
jgi:hypothetical protein